MEISRKSEKKIAPEMFGIFIEDINFGADGGLYAEMIENRSFEAKEAFGPGVLYTVDDFGYAWTPVSREGAVPPRMQYVSGSSLSAVNPHYLRLTTYEKEQGFANKAYDGICLKKGCSYRVSFHARCVRFEGEHFTVQIVKDGTVSAQGCVTARKALPYLAFVDLSCRFEVEYPPTKERFKKIKKMDDGSRIRQNSWYQYDLTITAEEDLRGGQFRILLDEAGIVEFDLISMIPEDAVDGVFRRDLFDAVKALKPGFIRFPGGCIVEGFSLENRYQWKQTVGELKDRKYKPNLWAFNEDPNQPDDTRRPDSHYGQSYGIGFYEYFLLCELTGAKALPVIGIGAACQFRTTEMTSSDDPAFETYIQDALDLIEFANGPADSVWGSVRASMGHPEPFGLEMLGIGNEQWETRYLDYYDRYRRFEEAIHAKYPDIRLIGSAGPIVQTPFFDDAWEFYRKKAEHNKAFCYAVDEHYYMPEQWMYDNVAFYDDYPRDVAVFAGEYAAHTEHKDNNMTSALAEASFLTGIEKNADVVKLAAYAPLFNRIGHSQWVPDLIWFDDRNVYLTPNYYVQKFYANHTGDRIMELNGQDTALRSEGIYLSATISKENEVILKVANTTDKAYELPLSENGSPVCSAAKMWVLTGGEEREGMPQRSVVTETEKTLDGRASLPAKSFCVIRF